MSSFAANILLNTLTHLGKRSMFNAREESGRHFDMSTTYTTSFYVIMMVFYRISEASKLTRQFKKGYLHRMCKK